MLRAMPRAFTAERLQELLVPHGPLAWSARLVVWSGLAFALHSSVKSMLDMPLDPARDFILISVTTGPLFVLAMLAGRLKDNALSHMTDTALTDELTGLMNRRAFLDKLERGAHGAVLLIDIDHFKRVNDRYGHAAGDAVLMAMSGHLSSHIRQGDIMARIGGEEFALFLEDADSQTIDRIGERLCAGFVIFNDRVLSPVKVTMSIGAAYSHMASGTSDLLRKADQALYQAKRSGRARLAFWQPPVTSRH